MKPHFPRRVTAIVYGVAILFLATAATVATVIVWEAHQKTLSDHESQAVRFVAGSEAALNRALLSVDMLLAGANELLRDSTAGSAGVNAGRFEAHRLLDNVVRQNLLVRHVAFVDASGTVIASSDRRGAQLPLALPAGFVSSVLANPVSTLAISAPASSLVTSQNVLFFARAVTLADGARMVGVAEVQLSLLATIMTQGAGIRGLEVTLERDAGPLLASLPPRDDLTGKQIEPALHEQTSDGKPSRMAARLSGLPAIVVARPTLHRNMLIVASIPLTAALRDWRRERDLIAWTAAGIGLMILAVARFTHVQLRRQWRANNELGRSKSTLDQALESMIDGFILLDAENRVLSWNRSFIAMFPWTAPMIAPQLPFRRIMDETARHVVHDRGAADWTALNMPQMNQVHSEQEALLQSGQVIRATRSRTPDGGTVCVYQDITEKRRHTAAIIESKAQLQATLDALPDLLLEVGLDGRCHGYHAPRGPLPVTDVEDPVGRRLPELLPAEAVAEVMSSLREADATGYSAGRQFERRGARDSAWFEISVSRKSVGDEVDTRFIVILRNITESKLAAHEIEHLAFYDTLTGLPNRRLLEDRIANVLQHATRQQNKAAVMYLDLDGFKTINDTHGHACGDEILKQVAQRLIGSSRREDTVARVGGDEFVIVLGNIAAPADAQEPAAKLIEAVSEPYQVGGLTLRLSTSIGIGIYPDDADSVNLLIAEADAALYEAKRGGKNRCCTAQSLRSEARAAATPKAMASSIAL